jgi:hypothetical protein
LIIENDFQLKNIVIVRGEENEIQMIDEVNLSDLLLRSAEPQAAIVAEAWQAGTKSDRGREKRERERERENGKRYETVFTFRKKMESFFSYMTG